ncbi:BlaI/MecI/CopY family transcriptional regulator [Pseudoalteromonas sp. SCSIO 43095]|uniref:BlaI/MecI/CopY family transcriptional regulator n=1 Tax=Pseudoalteromonas sp. SCSIO 43095 TaxID=2894202 RepID=UPI00202ACF3D|nr:BlaI/MecI/CopY family transcriptional regulator [Pseudoalteromonas sp. SCSIO 43095]URQ98712.1 BlaI/MecI/CopY family transcriptional regulator [Pseudoalteromonas sp. SCSIO 43095]
MIELSKAEFEVLDALWINYPATASQIIERLSDDKQWHEKTIKTLLGRIAPLVSGFAKSDQLSQQDINELKKVIDDWENNQK